MTRWRTMHRRANPRPKRMRPRDRRDIGRLLSVHTGYEDFGALRYPQALITLRNGSRIAGISTEPHVSSWVGYDEADPIGDGRKALDAIILNFNSPGGPVDGLAEFERLYMGKFEEAKPIERESEAHWEAVHDHDDPSFWRVRWSEPDAEGRYLYVRHYGSGSATWNEHVARTQAEDFNEDGRSPFEWDSYRPKRKELPE
jgi:hypothetical protein